MPTMNDVFTRYAGRSLANQCAFTDWIGKHRWSLDIARGTVDFGKKSLFGKPRVQAVQIVGTQSDSDETFLWAWADTQGDLTPEVLRAAESVRQWGEKNKVAELTEQKISMTEWDGHQLAMIAAGITNAPAYYCGPYDGGAVFFLLTDVPVLPPAPVERIVTVLSQVISTWELDNKKMATAFLEQEGFAMEIQGDSLLAKHADGRELSLEFDEQGRIADMSTSVGR